MESFGYKLHSFISFESVNQNTYYLIASAAAALGVYLLSKLFFSKPKKSVSGKVVLVTGGGSGLGRLTALRFAKLGSDVVIWDINEEGASQVAAECRSVGSKRALSYKIDLSNNEQVYQVAEKVKQEMGGVDILINNAGIVTGKKLLESPDSLILKTFQVNTLSLFWTAKAFLPDMIEKNSGHIVTISSMAGCVGVAGLADYCASKFGAFGFNESLRFELEKTKKSGVKTTVVCPYYINTGMFDGVKSKSFLLPIMEPDYVVDKIVDGVLTNKEWIMLPWFASFLPITRCFPVPVFDALQRFLGVSDTMDHFKGRK